MEPEAKEWCKFHREKPMRVFIRPLLAFLLLLALTSCTANNDTCPLTRPEWLLAPDDPAVSNPPAYGNYFVNEDLSIWASAWRTDSEEYQLSASEDGIKVGWFRPEGT